MHYSDFGSLQNFNKITLTKPSLAVLQDTIGFVFRLSKLRICFTYQAFLGVLIEEFENMFVRGWLVTDHVYRAEHSSRKKNFEELFSFEIWLLNDDMELE
ncbi:4-hydroxybenzoate geranyltransferase [Dirofilaria immitis]